MNRQKKECKSCEIKMTITVTESNFDAVDDVEINYCPVCSAEFYEDEGEFFGDEDDD